MGVRLVVAVTDRDWFETLRRVPVLEEVNFWAPGGAPFKALSPGELFVFKLHAPDNFIVGGGVFAHSSSMPCSLAWEAFGLANGATSLAEMRRRIGKYRKVDPGKREDFVIGCRVLTQPFFLDEFEWLSVPKSWSPNIVTLKSYSTDDAEGLELWERVRSRLAAQPRLAGLGEADRFGAPALVRPRLGQGAFRMVVTDQYQRRCAVTNERTLPALEAAHIVPYAEGGSHEPSNGLLLRRDIHSLLDAGYVTVTPEMHFEVSRRIKEEFENGRDYYRLNGNPVSHPLSKDAWPSPARLRWHNENSFLG